MGNQQADLTLKSLGQAGPQRSSSLDNLSDRPSGPVGTTETVGFFEWPEGIMKFWGCTKEIPSGND